MSSQSKPTVARHRDLVRTMLGRLGVYERVRVSWIYDLYWRFADKRIVDDRKKEARFYRNLLREFRSGDLVFDVGANVGDKARIFLGMGATVVAIEPDEQNQIILRQKFLSHRVKNPPLTIIGKAVSAESSIQKMWIDAPGSALNTLSNKWAESLREDETRFGERLSFAQSRDVETVSIEDLIRQHGVPFFLKIDVEGHELSVLRGMRRPVPYVSFEVNLPEFQAEGLECIQILAQLAQEGQFNYSSDFRRGLRHETWLTKEEISSAIASSPERSVEVFWRTLPLQR